MINNTMTLCIGITDTFYGNIEYFNCTVPADITEDGKINKLSTLTKVQTWIREAKEILNDVDNLLVWDIKLPKKYDSKYINIATDVIKEYTSENKIYQCPKYLLDYLNKAYGISYEITKPIDLIIEL